MQLLTSEKRTEEVMIKLSPSILAGDFSRLGEEICLADHAGSHMIHIDVMDGLFVPSISYGMPVIESIRKVTDKCFDVHLMIEKPERYIEDFACAGADMITVHAEATSHLERAVHLIHECGKKAGIVLNPATPLCMLDYVLDKVEMVLLMTVNPGFGGQQYVKESTRKIRELRQICNDRKLDIDIEVDGGITLSNVREVIEAGATVIVAGSSIFHGDINTNVEAFLSIFREYER